VERNRKNVYSFDPGFVFINTNNVLLMVKFSAFFSSDRRKHDIHHDNYTQQHTGDLNNGPRKK
jgi:hypothetical protein